MFRLSKAKDPFFTAFSEHARVTVRAAGLLRQLFETPTEVAEIKAQITLAEHEGDELTRRTITRLRSQWITPLDRPDIHTLITRLDDVLDVIESIAERIQLFDIRETSQVASEAARVLESSAQAVSKAVDLLPEARKRAPQITMGIITAALLATGHLPHHATGRSVPLWVVLACHTAMALGTVTGGWRIVRTLGMGVAKLQPVGGFAAETSGAITLFLATKLGIPVSTTHTIAGAIMGVGSVTKLSAVRWGVASRMLLAWLLTIPCSALLASLTFLLASALGIPR